MKLTNIGTRSIPVNLGRGVTELTFTGGAHGKKESGIYRFWTCVGEDEFGERLIIGRARRNLPPGDRVARMQPKLTKNNPPDHRKIYTKTYRWAQKHALYIRPSTEREVDRWALSHKEDMAFAQERCVIRGRQYTKRPRCA